MFKRRAPLVEMDPCFEPLAVYNAERARGIVHTPEYDAEMATLQQRFNEWVRPGRQDPQPRLPSPFEAER